MLRDAKQRDISEADTVTIIKDILADVLGYDKYKDVSSEHAIRGTYVDLVVTVDEKQRFLIEAKAINIELKDRIGRSRRLIWLTTFCKSTALADRADRARQKEHALCLPARSRREDRGRC